MLGPESDHAVAHGHRGHAGPDGFHDPGGGIAAPAGEGHFRLVPPGNVGVAGNVGALGTGADAAADRADQDLFLTGDRGKFLGQQFGGVDFRKDNAFSFHVISFRGAWRQVYHSIDIIPFFSCFRNPLFSVKENNYAFLSENGAGLDKEGADVVK